MTVSGQCRQRLAVLITHPVQYFQPLFDALAHDPKLDLLVVFGCDHGVRVSHDPDFGIDFAWDSAPTDGFPHVFASELPLSGLARWRTAWPCAKRSFELIRRFEPDCVLVFAYTPIFIALTTLLLGQSRHRLMLRAEATDRALLRSRFKNFVRDIVLKYWYRQFDAVFPIGSDSNDHFARLGVAVTRRFPVSYSVNTAFFSYQLSEWMPQRQSLRDQLGIAPADLALLWSGKMTDVKNPQLLIQALRLLPKDILSRFWLLAMGDGPLRASFESQAMKILNNRCRFMGFRNQRELGMGYAASDALVFPSSQGETWGLVVNEALQFGLAVLASDHPGSVRDLLVERDDAPLGSTVFSSNDPDALAQALHGLALLHPDGFDPSPVKGLPCPRDLADMVVSQIG